jgi:hypothetical protein
MLKQLPADQETYLLNGVLHQPPLTKETYNKLVNSPLAFVYYATRQPSRKSPFKIVTQESYLREVRTSLVISQFSVCILCLGEEISQATKEHSFLLSRFFMHDLTKITSRKSTTRVITFYFRIPRFEDYKSAEIEADSLTKVFSKPSGEYTFAFKREVFADVSLSFMFDSEEEAKSCI